MAHKEQWGSRLGFLLSAVGSAVGLGNIWRFPYQAYENGGGAFLIPYFIAALTAGIPLLILDFSIGHKYRCSVPTIYKKISQQGGGRSWEWLGWFQVLCGVLIATFYSVILSWVFYYLILSFTKGWGDNCEVFFYHEFLKISQSPFEWGAPSIKIIALTALVWFFIWAIVHLGVHKGIEKAGKIFMPLLAFIMIFLMIYQLFLPGSIRGVEAFFKPDFQRLKDINIWITAYGQIFFSMSLGIGTMITYTSYLSKKSDITNNAFLAAFMDCTFSIVSGILIFATLGTMSLLNGVEINEVVQGGPALTFVTLPYLFNKMPGAFFIGPLFFISLAVAGITSVISLIEPLLCALSERTKITRQIGVTLICIFGFLFSTIFTFPSGIYTLDIVDYFSSHIGMILGGLLNLILFAWIRNPRILADHANKVSDFKIGKIWIFCISVLTPFILIIMMFLNLNTLFSEDRYENYSQGALFLFGWTSMGIMVLLAHLLKAVSSRHRRSHITQKN